METDTREDHTVVDNADPNGNEKEVEPSLSESYVDKEDSGSRNCEEDNETEQRLDNEFDRSKVKPVLLPNAEEDQATTKNCSSPRPMSNDSGVSTPASDTELITANPVNIPSSVITHSAEHSTIVSISSENLSPNMTNSLSPPQSQNQQPQRRRPGRPPGSTKKYRQGAGMNGTACGAPSSVFRRGTDFTLRKFFEAGGRDYNEYLDWLKRRDNGESVPFLNSNPVISHMNHPQGAHIQGGHIPVVPYQSMPYMPRPVPTSAAIPVAYRQVPTQPHSGPIRVPSINFYNHHEQSHPGLKRKTEEVLDLSAKKKLDPNGNVIGRIGHKTPPCSTTNDRLEGCDTMPHPMTTWGVEKVATFVGDVPGCQDYVEVFREQKIDGATLPHLSEEHLLNIVKMKLGPAIRLRLEVQKLTTVT